MNIKPIIFSKPMILSLLAGNKTMTRRVVTGTALAWLTDPDLMFTPEFVAYVGNNLCPQGNVGDLLWVKETHYVWGNWKEDGKTKTGKTSWKFIPIESDDHPVLYCNNTPKIISKRKWGNDIGYYKRPSIFMERKNARIFLQLESIKIEKVQDISEEDAVREGVLQHPGPSSFKTPHWLNYMDEKANLTQFIYNLSSAAESFKTLWMLIHGFRDEQYAWFKNPWVWCEGFKILTDADTDVIAAASKQIESAADHLTDARRYSMDFAKGPNKTAILEFNNGNLTDIKNK